MSTSNKSSTHIQWMWKANVNSFSSTEPAEWRRYSDVEDMLIEAAFTNGKTYVMFDNYHIDFKIQMQISNNDIKKQRPVKRVVCNSDDVPVREERFTFTPITTKSPFTDHQGWIPLFIKAAAKHLDITRDQLPSKNEKMIPIIVDRAAIGIFEEGKLVGRGCEGEKIANILLERREAEMGEVWRCCAYLYSLESFLYKKINEIMRLVGDAEHEREWRNKISTLGPFCLLLWDNPFDDKNAKKGTILYRGAKLDDQLISMFQEDCSKSGKPIRSFPSFTSCSRDRTRAEKFGNALFIMTIKHAFTVDLVPFSKYPHEEEELLYPGVCFTVDRADFDLEKKQHLIHLTLVQQFPHNNLNNDIARLVHDHGRRDLSSRDRNGLLCADLDSLLRRRDHPVRDTFLLADAALPDAANLRVPGADGFINDLLRNPVVNNLINNLDVVYLRAGSDNDWKVQEN